MRRAIIDNSVLSRYLYEARTGNDGIISRKVVLYLLEHSKLEFSVLTRFEKERGLIDCGAKVQLDALDRLCRQSILHPVDEIIARKASVMWAKLKSNGRMPKSIDALIAATASVKGCVVAHVDRDFDNFSDFVEVENWLTE